MTHLQIAIEIADGLRNGSSVSLRALLPCGDVFAENVVDAEGFDGLKLAVSGSDVWEEWGDARNEVSRLIIDNLVVLYCLVETAAELVQVLCLRSTLNYLSLQPRGLTCFLRGAKGQFDTVLS